MLHSQPMAGSRGFGVLPKNAFGYPKAMLAKPVTGWERSDLHRKRHEDVYMYEKRLRQEKDRGDYEAGSQLQQYLHDRQSRNVYDSRKQEPPLRKMRREDRCADNQGARP